MCFRWTWFWKCRGDCEIASPHYRFSWERNWQHDFLWIKERCYE